MIRAALPPLALIAALTAVAHGDAPTLRDADNYYQVDLPASWKRVTPAPGPETILVAARHAPTERTLAITRIDYPNPDRKARAYHDRIEAGLRASVPGYERLRRSTRKLAHVYAIDLVFRRGTDADREVVWMRIMLYRSFTLTAAVAAPAVQYRTSDRDTRKLLASVQPYAAD